MSIIESAALLLRDARSRAGITQTELAARAGCTQSVVSAYESGQRQPSLPVLLRLVAATGHDLHGQLIASTSTPRAPLSGPLGRRVSRNRRKITTITGAYGISQVRVFGSVARGTEAPDSDIDLLVALPAAAGLFTLGRVRRDLEDLLQAKIDLVPDDSLKLELSPGVLADAVSL